ncbi:MAG: S41 family peptidase [Bacteroidota bacterium]
MKINLKKHFWFVLLLSGAFLVGFRAGDLFEIAKSMDIFGKVYTEINTVFVDETNPTDLMRTGIDSMLKNLDPYTNYFSESQIETSKIFSTGEYSGIGAEVGLRGDKVLILELFEESPAFEAGLLVGDQILKIDAEEVYESRMSLDKVNSLLLGERGSNLALSIRRPGQEDVQVIDVSRGGTETQAENVPYFAMATPEVGYILQTGFMTNAGKEVADALKKLKEENDGMKAVILDLRGNPGGQLNEAVNVSNVFVPKGELITEMKGRSRDSKAKFYTRMSAIDQEIPLAVLVNSGSASASEIVSGSIQDLDRGVVLGQRSFGKGLVQNFRPLSYNTQMKVTIARYYTPSGRCIQAIDYSNRNADGSVGKVPKELITEYQTRNGRPVYDGGGVMPDLPIEKKDNPPILKALTEQGFIFDFVTAFAQENENIEGPRAFKLSDEIYEDFSAFVREKGLTFSTLSENQIDKLSTSLKKNGYEGSMESLLKEVREKLEAEKKQDLIRHKEAIKTELKREIINRYYFKQGVLESAFVDDPVILKAVETVLDEEAYNNILRIQK